MDESKTLSEFIAHTGADPGLAQDILQGQQWDLSKSLQAYYFLRGLTATSTMPNLTSTSFVLREDKDDDDDGESKKQLPPTIRNPRDQYNGSRGGGGGGGPSESSGTVTPNSPSKPVLQKAEAIDLDDAGNKKLTRGISRATDNVNLVSKARNEFALDFKEPSSSNSYIADFIDETPVYTFTLPDLTIYSDDFVAFLEKDLIETSTLVSLEQAGRLNWWTESGACQRLWPLATTGDGNCLLHAASLGMWGFHDRLLTLRKALHATLTKGSYRGALWRRWRWQQTLQNKEAGLVYSEEEWQKEWNNLLRLSSTEPRSRPGKKDIGCNSPATRGTVTRGIGILDPVMEHNGEHDIYESLEEIHVLALAHVLRRPIIVVADVMLKDVTGEPFAPIPFGGVYLPLECRPSQCHRSPLVLTYDAAHFSALVAMEREAYVDKTPQPAAVIPLTDSEHQLLPLQYAVDPGENFNWGFDEMNQKVVYQLTLTEDDKLTLLLQYLDVEQVPVACEKPSIELPGQPMMANGMSDMDKKSSGGSFESDDSSPSSTETAPALLSAKGRTAKQLQSVAKQFGSIGRSMSKKLKKNFGNFKLGRSNSYKESAASLAANKLNDHGHLEPPSPKPSAASQQRHTLPNTSSSSSSKCAPPRISRSQNYILAAKLNTERRHEYQEEMLKNYLYSARLRFEKTQKEKKAAAVTTTTIPTTISVRDVVDSSQTSSGQCLNPSCSRFSSSASSYLCTGCFERHKDEEHQALRQESSPTPEQNVIGNSSILYGIGRSRFYAEAEGAAAASGDDRHSASSRTHSPTNLSSFRKPTPLNPDQTLYLSNSTFYNDTNTPPTGVAAATAAACEKSPSPTPTPIPLEDGPLKACRTPKCPFYGAVELDFYCSQCHKEQRLKINTYPRLSNNHMKTTLI